MIITDKTTHERRIFAHFSEDDLKDILQRYITDKQGVCFNKNVELKLRFNKKDAGDRGFINHVELTIVDDLSKQKGELDV